MRSFVFRWSISISYVHRHVRYRARFITIVVRIHTNYAKQLAFFFYSSKTALVFRGIYVHKILIFVLMVYFKKCEMRRSRNFSSKFSANPTAFRYFCRFRVLLSIFLSTFVRDIMTKRILCSGIVRRSTCETGRPGNGSVW